MRLVKHLKSQYWSLSDLTVIWIHTGPGARIRSTWMRYGALLGYQDTDLDALLLHEAGQLTIRLLCRCQDRPCSRHWALRRSAWGIHRENQGCGPELRKNFDEFMEKLGNAPAPDLAVRAGRAA